MPDAYELQEGDICNIDVTVYYDGHHGDLNETYYVGEVSVRSPKPPLKRTIDCLNVKCVLALLAVQEETRHLVQTSYESLFKGIEMVRPKELYRNVGNAVSK